MDDIAEKRVHDDRTGATTTLVGAEAGLARVAVSGDSVGEFGLVSRDEVRDVAVADGRIAVATPRDVLAGARSDLAPDGDGLAETGFGPADAVGFDDDLLAAGDGRVARRMGEDWSRTAEVAGVRTVAGGLLAAADGVYLSDGRHVGLDDVRDVAPAGPLAATAEGLYHLANGWVRAVEGSFRAVEAAGDRAHAATADTVLTRGTAPGSWDAVGDPARDLVALARAPEATYAATRDGTFCVDAGSGWRTRALGLPGVAAMSVLRTPVFEV